VEIPATSDNIPGTLVLRDASGNLSAGTVTSGRITTKLTGFGGLDINCNADFGNSEIICRRSRGTFSSPTVVNNGDLLLTLAGQGYDGSTYRNAAFILFGIDATPGSGDMPGTIIFSTTADGASFPTEKLRITSSGNVGIGTTSPAYTLHVNGSVAGTSAYNNLSDAREKENITYGIAAALETVKALKPAKFDFKEGEKNKIGFIAQDVQPLVPEVITTYEKTLEDDTKEERLSIQESSLTAVLVAAIQELTAKVEALEAALQTQ
jgi:predicted DNA-binding antitoxin AbrB/MazE fold protein